MNKENLAFLEYIKNLRARIHPLCCIPCQELAGAVQVEEEHKKLMKDLKKSFSDQLKEFEGLRDKLKEK